MQSLSPTKTNILIALAKFKFLTISQMVQLKVATQRTNINTNLTKLKNGRGALIGEIPFPFVPNHGRAETLYFLKPKAKELLVEEYILEEDKIKVPKGSTTVFTRDYFHRKYTIGCIINQYLQLQKEGGSLLWFDYYFDKLVKSQNGTRAKNKVNLKNGNYMIPDAIFMTETAKGEKRLWLFEMFCDKGIKRPYETLLKHREALIEGSASIKYNFDKANRVLCVFEHESVLKSVKEKFEQDEDFEGFRVYFVFENWQSI
ncbi:MAG: hypothetical protein N4A45_03300 [Flavobacteriales bacterium]|jgi:hypothetical protein|nr:hypothetical protein [Flavobacteriales bacterium]